MCITLDILYFNMNYRIKDILLTENKVFNMWTLTLIDPWFQVF